MQKIDTHQHFWKYNPINHSWINEGMTLLKNDFTPDDLFPLLEKTGFDGCIAVQVDEDEADNDFLLSIANQNEFVKGVIGWVDLLNDNIEARLNHYQQFNKLKGFRYMLQGKEPRDLMLSKDFTNGVGLLNKYNFIYEILILSDQLPYVNELVSKFPEQPFVINHLAKPMIKYGKIKQWSKEIKAIAKHENISCKVSGMVTEADWKNWNYHDFNPYLDVVFNAFGADRLMFGSDWPVCNLAGGYHKVYEIMERYTLQLSATEQEKFWGGNALAFYQIK
ncbi:amidohydrolase [Pedobacter psychrophilus]|uniref:Amidohydrolase n=1 Tax=Pedobacter psychrophilus TaxID=1826909 RepID=A0A179DLP5_9SPHI|nr:amidohydrolase family protein [Pedobacter psychrophilus]OAQ42026.1 amidohydrolase [Pedobacter psychrophilus]